MAFSACQLHLFSQSCYGDPQLPEYLERIVLEGPGEYDWPPAPGVYEGEQIPLWERVSAQIWHQGDIYPATYVALPVLCEVVARFPHLNHARMLSLLLWVEQSRPRFEAQLLPELDAKTLETYQAALKGLLPHLPAQLLMQDDVTSSGIQDAQTILVLLAFATGKRWAGTLLSGRAPLLDYSTGKLSPALLNAAELLQARDLPQAEIAEYERWKEAVTRPSE